MTDNRYVRPADKLLEVLDGNPDFLEYYFAAQIERLPADMVAAQLSELGVDASLPPWLEVTASSQPGPAEELLLALDAMDIECESDIEMRPLLGVTTELNQLRVNHIAGFARMEDLLGREDGQVVGDHPAKPPRWSRRHFLAAVQIADAIAILSGSTLSVFIHRYFLGVTHVGIGTAIIAAVVIAAVARYMFPSMGAYENSVLTKRYASGFAAAASWFLGIGPLLFLVLVVTQYAQGSDSRGWIITWYVCTTILIATFRGVSAYVGIVLLRSGYLRHTICIIGDGNEARSCAAKIKRDKTDLFVHGYFRVGEYDPKTWIDMPCLGKLTQLSEFRLQHRVDELIIATSPQQHQEIEDLISSLRSLPVSLTIWPESVRLPVDRTGAADRLVRDLPLLQVGTAPLQGWRYWLKDVLDRTLALVMLIWSLPLFVLITIGIRLSSQGPVFVHQTRIGCHGRQFSMLTFRTIDVVASQPIDKLVRAAQADGVFRLGALLRKTSLEKLPRLLNVLAGHMWLVGPPSHPLSAAVSGWLYPDAFGQFLARHRIKPGITGWAQVNGWLEPINSTEQFEQRIAYDLYYIENWSPLLDLRTLFKTLMLCRRLRSIEVQPVGARHDFIGWVLGPAPHVGQVAAGIGSTTSSAKEARSGHIQAEL
jgi:lipopolysaccharide/colanic/teichoic acid biosynthesis glycosyltransferase